MTLRGHRECESLFEMVAGTLFSAHFELCELRVGLAFPSILVWLPPNSRKRTRLIIASRSPQTAAAATTLQQ